MHILLPPFVATGEFSDAADTGRGVLHYMVAYCNTAAVEPADCLVSIDIADLANLSPYPVVSLGSAYVSRGQPFVWHGFIELGDSSRVIATKYGDMNQLINVELSILKPNYSGALLEYIRNATST